MGLIGCTGRYYLIIINTLPINYLTVLVTIFDENWLVPQSGFEPPTCPLGVYKRAIIGT